MNVALTKDKVYSWLAGVTDPEVPVLTVMDMGVIRDVKVDDAEKKEVTVVITPTYSGCPAMDMISMNVRLALMSKGITKVNIEQQLSPAWTTDWMTDDGKRKLKEYGIAPPKGRSDSNLGLFEEEGIECPRCGSTNTEMVSRFGPTSCKALYKCLTCKEPFEYFKCH